MSESLRSFLRTALTKKGTDARLDDFLAGSTSRRSNTEDDGRKAPGTPLTVVSQLSPRSGIVPSLDPTLDPSPAPPKKPGTKSRSYSTSFPEGRRPSLPGLAANQGPQPHHHRNPSPDSEARRLFKPLEIYITAAFTSFQCLNSSFLSNRFPPGRPNAPDAARRAQTEAQKDEPGDNHPIADLDPKLLLLGDFAENGAWWTGGQEGRRPSRTVSHRSNDGHAATGMRSPHIDWADLDEWYLTVIEAAQSWPFIYAELVKEDASLVANDDELCKIEGQILAGQEHVQRTLLKATETILKRPGRPISEPHQLRFLLIIAGNPLLRASEKFFSGQFPHPEIPAGRSGDGRGAGPSSGKHSGILKRILGLMSNSSLDCQNHLQTWIVVPLPPRLHLRRPRLPRWREHEHVLVGPRNS